MTWFALTTSPAAERKVRDALSERGVAAYYPIERVWRTRPGRRDRYDRPLIRGYVFAELDGLLHLAHEIEGAQLLRISGRLATLPPEAVKAFQDAEEGGLYDRTQRKGVQLRKGAKVRVRQGPFTGLAGSIIRLDGARRAQVLLDMFGRAWPTMIDQAKLEMEV